MKQPVKNTSPGNGLKERKVRRNGLQRKLKLLYDGRSRRAVMFRFGLLAFDIFVISFFVVTSLIPERPWMVHVDYGLAVLMIIDVAARLWIAGNKRRFMVRGGTIIDLIVIASLIAPAFFDSVAFLRIVRALRLLRSYHVLSELRRRYRFFRVNEEVIQSSINLGVFIFIVTALVYVFQVHVNAEINNYIDALYFTVTTLTTTGFGDITLTGTSGRILSVLIMVLGVALFLRLVQAIFRPGKVNYACPECGLNRHDPDAVHCKHCGNTICIATEGEA